VKGKLEDIIISEFLISLGPWKKYVVVGGGFALFIYKLYLADQALENFPVGTRDVDSLIPRKVPDTSKKNIAQHMATAGFKQHHKAMDHPATEAYVKEIEGVEVEIEFLTSDDSRKDKHANVNVSGIIAQPLRYLNMSLQMTTEFKTYSGVTGRVVTPGAWMFHKGLTFTRRKSTLKQLKDLYGIWYVTTQLGTFSNQAIEEFHLLAKLNQSWFKGFRKNLLSWHQDVTPDKWSILEGQDPSGKLKKMAFERALKKLLPS
jgi:hypothetical protein